MSLGKRVKKFRKLKSLTILNVRELTGLSKSTISEIENDNTSPTATTLNKLAKALQVPVEEFFKEEKTKEKIMKEIINIDKNITTIAAHFEGEEFTKEDKYDIENFIKYVLSKKK